MHPRFFLFSLLLAPAFAVAAAAPLELPIVKPERGDIYRWVALPGVLAPYRQVQLSARISGYVKQVKVDRGDVVKAGQVLVVIEVPDLEWDLLKMQGELNAAEVEVKRLHEARAKSPDLVLAQTVDNAEARVSGAQASVDRCRVQLEFAQIKAPFDGQITSRFVDEGAFVAAGSGTLLRLVENQKLRCQIPVTEMEAPLVVLGKPVRIVPDAMAGKVFETTVARASGLMEQSSRTMMVEADVVPATAPLIAGMSVTAKIGVEKHADVLRVPAAAVLVEKSGPSVFRFADGRALKTPVKVGFSDGSFFEVPELKGDEALILFGTAALNDGQAVSARASSPQN